jgi:hypothetical protein
MSREILAIAIYQPLPDMEAASLGAMRELIWYSFPPRATAATFFIGMTVLNTFCCVTGNRKSHAEQAGGSGVQRCWARLGNEVQLVKGVRKARRSGREERTVASFGRSGFYYVNRSAWFCPEVFPNRVLLL